MGECEMFKSFRGSAPDPAGGLTAPPRPPAGEGPCCARLVLLCKTYRCPSFTFFVLRPDQFLFCCYGPGDACARRSVIDDSRRRRRLTPPTGPNVGKYQNGTSYTRVSARHNSDARAPLWVNFSKGFWAKNVLSPSCFSTFCGSWEQFFELSMASISLPFS